MKILLALAAVAFAMPAAADNYNGRVAFKSTTPQVAKDSIRFGLDVVLDQVALGNRTLITLTPKLVSADGTQTYAFPAVSVGGRNRQIMWKRHNIPGNKPVYHKNGSAQTVSLNLAAPNVSWVKKARLVVDEQVQGCAGCEQGEMRYNLIERMVKEEYRPQFTTVYVTPKPEPVKTRSGRFVARFNFRLNRTELLPELANNRAEFARVDSVANAILLNPDVKVKNVSIDGYASPEGTDAGNLRLSQNRALAFADYLRQTYKLSRGVPRGFAHSSDWEGLRNSVMADPNVPNKQAVLDIIDAAPVSDVVRRENLRQLDGGRPYAYLLEKIYPPLRRTEYQFDYTVRNFNLEEALQRIYTNPVLLSLNEMYLVADHYPAGSAERRNALETAQRVYPNAPESRFNALAYRMSQGEEVTDEAFLVNYAASPEKWNNLGVYYGLHKDYERAKECFSLAGNLPAAQANLAEIEKAEE